MLDPRRRFRDRLLIGMVAVALLPLAAFAVLAAFDLDAIGKSTAEAAQGAILQDERARQQSTVAGHAGLIDQRMDDINSELGKVAGQILVQLSAPGTPVLPPVGLVPYGGAGYIGGAGQPTSAVLPGNATAADVRMIDVSGTQPALALLQGLRQQYTEIQSVWVANQSDTALRAVPGFDVAAAIVAGRLDPNDPLQRYRGDVFTTAQTRYGGSASNWVDPTNPLGNPGGPYWTDPYPLLGSGAVGVTVWQPLHYGRTTIGVDLSLTGLVAAALASTASTPLPPASYPLMLSSDGIVLYGGLGLSQDFGVSSDLTGSPLPVTAKSGLAAGLKRIETTGAAPATPLAVELSGVAKDVFAAPIYAGRWVLTRPVPLSDLQPDLTGLTTGVTAGVHRLFPLVVLPALVLLLGLAFLAATLLSRRLVGPVRNLTVAAELLATGETSVPVPPQGGDEVGVLSSALERMRREINASRQAILAAAAELEGRVNQRTRELRARNDELVALNDLAGSLTRSLEPQLILEDALQAIRAIHPLRSGRGYVLEGETLSAVAGWPDAMAPGIAEGAPLEAMAAETIRNSRPLRRRAGAGILLGWPLATRHGLVGALAVDTETTPSADKRRLLQAVADQVALALRTSLLSAAGREHAVLEERTRLAREIHDTLAQQLTGIVIQLEAADTLVERGSDRARQSVEIARDLARAALQEARRSVWNLRPAPLAATGLVAALEGEVRAWESRSGIPARFRKRSVGARPALQPASEVALLRTVQEALSNVARHSGASAVTIALKSDGDEIVLTVHDNGVGFDAASEPPRSDCFGLEGMRERVRLAGGTLIVMSSPGAGTEITARLPLAEPTAVAHSA
jgi:signal transduction histidine kinase